MRHWHIAVGDPILTHYDLVILKFLWEAWQTAGTTNVHMGKLAALIRKSKRTARNSIRRLRKRQYVYVTFVPFHDSEFSPGRLFTQTAAWQDPAANSLYQETRQRLRRMRNLGFDDRFYDDNGCEKKDYGYG